MAVSVLNNAKFASVFKIKYGRHLEKQWLSKACAFMKTVKKTYNFDGESRTIHIATAHRSGSTVFSTAQANKGASVAPTRFTVTRVREYVIGALDNETMLASASKEGAVEAAIKFELDSMMQAYTRSADFQVWGNGSGVRGQALTGTGTATVTLADPRSNRDFERGMFIEFSVDTGGSAGAGILPRTGNLLEITAIDRDAGTITFDRVVSAAYTTVADGAYMFRADDYNNVLSGVTAWVPIAAPTSALFFGVNRTVDPTRLAGWRLTTTGVNIEAATIDALAKASDFGSKVDTLFVGSPVWAQLAKSQYSKVWYTPNQKYPDIGYEAISFNGPDGAVRVVLDAQLGALNEGRLGLMTEMDSWELAGLGQMPHFDELGSSGGREVAADGKEIRQACYWQLLNHRPGNSGIITFNL